MQVQGLEVGHAVEYEETLTNMSGYPNLHSTAVVFSDFGWTLGNKALLYRTYCRQTSCGCSQGSLSPLVVQSGRTVYGRASMG